MSVFCKSANLVTALSVSHDGAWLAVGMRNTGVSVRDLATGQEITKLVAGGHMVRVDFSPREPLLAYSTGPGYGAASKSESKIHLWNGATRQIVTTLPVGGSCYGLAFSADGRTLVTSTKHPHNQITLWRVSDGRMLTNYPAPQVGTGEGTPFAVGRDLRFAAHATDDGGMRVIDLTTGNDRNMKTADDYVTALAFSPDGKILASGAANSIIRLWDVISGRELGSLEHHRAGILQLVFCSDGKSLVSASVDQTIQLWDVTEPAHGRALRTLRGHKDSVGALALLPNGVVLVSGSADRSVCFWDTAAKPLDRKRLTLPVSAGPWRFTPDSKSLVILDKQGRVARWHGPYFQEMQPLLDLGDKSDEACFSEDGRWLAVSWAGGEVRVWDLDVGHQSCEFTANAKSVYPCQLMADGNKLMVVHRHDNSLHEWDLKMRQETRSWPGAPGDCTRAFSRDGHWCLTSIVHPNGTSTSLLDLTTGREARLNRDWNPAASFAADGKLFATSGWFSAARLWETATGKEVATLSGFLGSVRSLAFSPDGKRLVTGSGGKETIKLWEMENHAELLTLDAQESVFDTAAFSPDGNIIGSSNARGVLHLWRAPSWAEIEATERARAELVHGAVPPK